MTPEQAAKSGLEVRLCKEHFTVLPCWRCSIVALAIEINPRIKWRGGWKGDGPFPDTAPPRGANAKEDALFPVGMPRTRAYRGGAYNQEAAGIKRHTIATNDDGSCVALGVDRGGIDFLRTGRRRDGAQELHEPDSRFAE